MLVESHAPKAPHRWPVNPYTDHSRYTRDGLSCITGIGDPNLNSWTYAHDGIGNRTSVRDPDLGQWTYVYDTAGRLTRQTDAKAQTSDLTYDILSRVLTKTVAGPGLTTELTTNSYDLAATGYFNAGLLTAENGDSIIIHQLDCGDSAPNALCVPMYDPYTD